MQKWTWICHLLDKPGAGCTWTDYPVLHHDGPNDQPAEHNRYCGFYPYQDESVLEDDGLDITPFPMSHVGWPLRVG